MPKSMFPALVFTFTCGVYSVFVGLLALRRVFSTDTQHIQSLQEIASKIRKGAFVYLTRQYTTIAYVGVATAVVLDLVIGYLAGLSFVLGAVLSCSAGFIGMSVSVRANVRTAKAAINGTREAFDVALKSGSITGLLVTGLGLIGSSGCYIGLALAGVGQKQVIESLVTFVFGASLVSIFARLGGGIFTKGADIGADLVGKLETGIPEDDPRNPASIADSVGDNVGDCSGTAADIFETYALALTSATLLGVIISNEEGFSYPNLLTVYPLLVCAVCIIGSTIGIASVKIHANRGPVATFHRGLLVCCIISILFIAIATEYLFSLYSNITIKIGDLSATGARFFACSLNGFLTTLALVLGTNYYTSANYPAVLRIVDNSKNGPAMNVIQGLAISMEATAIPGLVICSSLLISYTALGFYGIAVTATAMLSLSSIIITFDAYGPIIDNAGSLVRMANLPPQARFTTDFLDAIGNTSKAITKAYATALASLAAIVVFIIYMKVCNFHLWYYSFILYDPYIIVGLLLGSLLPYLLGSMGMGAVVKASSTVVDEVHHQLAEKEKILAGKEMPEYSRVIDLLTELSLRKMSFPALLSAFIPIMFWWVISLLTSIEVAYIALGALLLGTVVTGFLMAVSMTVGGGAWDNAKKHIETRFDRGSQAHIAAVIGDVIGDPYKDTVGPFINSLVKIVSTITLLLLMVHFSCSLEV